MSRLAMVEREQLPESDRRFYDAVKAIRRRPVSGPFIVTLNSSPDLASRFAHLGHYFHSRGQADESILSARVRTFVALVGSRALDVPYEWNAWVGWALEAGVTQETVDALRENKQPAQLTGEETLALAVCRQLIAGDHRIDEATFHAAHHQFGIQGMVELAMTLGYFAMIAYPLNAFEIEMSNAQKALRKPFEPLAVPSHPGDVPCTRAHPSLRSAATNKARAPMLREHGDLKPADQHFLDRVIRTRGHISPIYQVLLHTPDVADRVASCGEFFLYEGLLSQRLRQLIGLITAREFDSNYVWVAHTGAAHLPVDTCDTIAAGSESLALPAQELLAARFCRQLLRGNHHVDDTTYAATTAVFGVPATIQIAATLGYNAMMAFVANAFDIAPDSTAYLPLL